MIKSAPLENNVASEQNLDYLMNLFVFAMEKYFTFHRIVSSLIVDMVRLVVTVRFRRGWAPSKCGAHKKNAAT